MPYRKRKIEASCFFPLSRPQPLSLQRSVSEIKLWSLNFPSVLAFTTSHSSNNICPQTNPATHPCLLRKPTRQCVWKCNKIRHQGEKRLEEQLHDFAFSSRTKECDNVRFREGFESCNWAFLSPANTKISKDEPQADKRNITIRK